LSRLQLFKSRLIDALEDDPQKCERFCDSNIMNRGEVLIAWVIQPKRNTPRLRLFLNLDSELHLGMNAAEHGEITGFRKRNIGLAAGFLIA